MKIDTIYRKLDEDGSGAIAAQEPTYSDADDADHDYDLGDDLGIVHGSPQAGMIREEEDEMVMVWDPKRQRQSFKVITGVDADVDAVAETPQPSGPQRSHMFSFKLQN